MHSRTCTNCLEQQVNESKQNFIYRCWEGNKWDACIRPVCDLCIKAGRIESEYYGGRSQMIMRLYLGTSRLHKPDENYGYGWGRQND